MVGWFPLLLIDEFLKQLLSVEFWRHSLRTLIEHPYCQPTNIENQVN